MHGEKKRGRTEWCSMTLDGVELQPRTSVKYLGVEIDKNLDWKNQVMKLRAKCFQALGRLKRISHNLPCATRKKLHVLCTCATPCWLLLCGMGLLFKGSGEKGWNNSKSGHEIHSHGALQELSWGRNWSGQPCLAGENSWPSKRCTNVSIREPPPSSVTNS